MGSTSSVLAAPVGAQSPRVLSIPEYGSSAGPEAVELSAMAGLILDPWQAFVLERSLGELPNGKWAAFEVGLVVPRQNGKGAVLEARELAGLFLLGERLIIHSAHQFDTSLEAFRRLLYLVESTPDFDRRVKRVSRSHGEEGIELKGGQRIRFRTRTKGGGRGFSANCVIFDEAMILPEATHGALLPTLSAQPNPQVWYAASAVDQFVHVDGVVLARIRQRGVKGSDPSLAYFEYSIDRDTPSRVDAQTAADLDSWAQANPGLGIRILPEHIDNESRSMDPRTFAVERLGVGDWPDPDGGLLSVITVESWMELLDRTSVAPDPVCFSFDVSPDRSMSTIAVSGMRKDGLAHVEVIDYKRGTGWLVDRIVELTAKHKATALICDGSGPAASLIPELEREGVKVMPVTAKEQAQACGLFFDAVDQARLRHLGSAEMVAAIRGAVKRPLGESWAWSRKNSSVDISPLVASTMAHWGQVTHPAKVYDGPLVAFG